MHKFKSHHSYKQMCFFRRAIAGTGILGACKIANEPFMDNVDSCLLQRSTIFDENTPKFGML